MEGEGREELGSSEVGRVGDKFNGAVTEGLGERGREYL